MNQENENLPEYLIRLATFIGSIILIAVIEGPLRASCGDALFVATVMFTLAGSTVIATQLTVFGRKAVAIIFKIANRKAP